MADGGWAAGGPSVPRYGTRRGLTSKLFWHHTEQFGGRGHCRAGDTKRKKEPAQEGRGETWLTLTLVSVVVSPVLPRPWQPLPTHHIVFDCSHVGIVWYWCLANPLPAT